MKKLVLLTATLIITFTSSFSQSCLPEGITFTTQEQIDSFHVNYPGCSGVEGSVYVIGSDITNLEGLYVLDDIGGDFVIGGTDTTGTSLVDLFGLYYLSSIGGGLYIECNPNLTSLIGMKNLEAESIDSLSINSNPLLSLCDAQCICDYLATPNAKVFISNNADGCTSANEVALNCENNCLPEGIYFNTQAEIDNFQANYPGCTEIMGMVTIEGDNISSLQGLNEITTIHGRLLIGRLYPASTNANLTSLNGLESLSYIGGFLYMNWNDNLINCSGLNNLNNIGGMLKFWGNGDLTNMNGFENLSSVARSVEIRSNYSLVDLSGLENLTSIGEDLRILYNHELISLSGTKSINYIGGKLQIAGNFELMNLNGFNITNPISLQGEIVIIENPLITDIYGLENFELGIIDGLYIYENPSLSSCDVQNICDYLADSTNIVEVNNNAPGCNDPEEVIEVCHYCLPDGITFSTQTQIDSFQINYPECVHVEGDLSVIGYSEISNLYGLNVISSIGGSLQLLDNYNLTNLSGLDNIASVGGDLSIEGNAIIESMTGLSNLTSIGNFLWMEDNESLNSLSGLENINPGSIEYLHIVSNPSLSKCQVQSICSYLLMPYNTVDIYDNAPGCNDQYEVYNACWVNIDDAKDNTTIFKVYPTPTDKWLNIKAFNFSSLYDIEIRNPFGQLFSEEKNIQSLHYVMNVDELKPGIFFYVIRGNEEVVQQGKLIIK